MRRAAPDPPALHEAPLPDLFAAAMPVPPAGPASEPDGRDRRNVLIADEEVAKRTVDHVPVYPREVMRRALVLNAPALILVHNHPSGDPAPSEADVAMTLAIRDAAQTLGIVLHDHIVVGMSAEVSFRSEELL